MTSSRGRSSTVRDNGSPPAPLIPHRTTRAVDVRSSRLGFGGHQTFPFRYGWLKKAVDAVAHDPETLTRQDAFVTLGVGKNMVDSIRHWGLATRLLVDGGRGRQLAVSEWGRLLFGVRSDDAASVPGGLGGFDPYLEDPASLWLIHWLLVTNPTRAAVWHVTFNHYPYPDFRRETLAAFVANWVGRHHAKTSKNTIERDIDCFVRTYGWSRIDRQGIEDSLNCPLAELGLLHHETSSGTFRFVIGPKPSLPVEIFCIALLRFFEEAGGKRQTLNLQDCLYGVNSPGQVFKLDETTLAEYVEACEALTGGALGIDETAGLKQLYRRHEVEMAPLLANYYGANEA